MDDIRDKIRKLLRLARDKGANPAEAESAMAMASKLMLQYNIEHVGDVDDTVRKAVKGNYMGVDRGSKWERMLAGAARILSNCKYVRRGGDYMFIGLPENIEMAEHMFLWLCDQVEYEYKQGLRTFKGQLGPLNKPVRANFRNTFKESCANRLWQRAGEINAFNRGNIPDHKALVVVDHALDQADAIVNEICGGKKSRAIKLHESGFGTGAGMTAGNRIQLNRAAEDRRQPTNLKRIG